MSLIGKLFKPTKDLKEAESTGFEIEDKPTPLAGKILLVIMAVLLLSLGWRALNDIYDIPKQPEPLSNCIRSYAEIKYDFSFRPKTTIYQQPRDLVSLSPHDCRFSKLEARHQIPEIYQRFQAARGNYDNLSKQINNLEGELKGVNSQLTSKQRQYNLALQEEIAQKPGAYDLEVLKLEVDQLEQQKSSLEEQISRLKGQRSTQERSFKPQEEALKQAAKVVSRDYNRSLALYRLIVFALQLLFALPVFFFSLKAYFKHKAKDSPYTLIFTTLIGVTAVLFARVVFSYIWALFLADLIIFLWDIIKNAALLRVLMYYSGMGLAILVFGGAVYVLQKKVFNPARVQRRRLKKSLCPYCEFPLQFSQAHCPGCGSQVKKKCPSCGEAKYKIMRFCPHCGAGSK